MLGPHQLDPHSLPFLLWTLSFSCPLTWSACRQHSWSSSHEFPLCSLQPAGKAQGNGHLEGKSAPNTHPSSKCLPTWVDMTRPDCCHPEASGVHTQVGAGKTSSVPHSTRSPSTARAGGCWPGVRAQKQLCWDVSPEVQVLELDLHTCTFWLGGCQLLGTGLPDGPRATLLARTIPV